MNILRKIKTIWKDWNAHHKISFRYIIKKWLKIFKKIKDTGTQLEEQLIGFWLRLCLKITGVYGLSFSFKRILLSILGFGILALVLYFVFKYNGKITNYLIFKNMKCEENMLFSSFFLTIGASILGVLAVTFSLTLFALQQAATMNTAAVLRNFLQDKISVFIFWIIGSIALLFFIFSLIPLNNFLFYEVLLCFIFLVLILFLLWEQYKHIVKIVNPCTQIISYHNKGIILLEKVDKYLDLMIKAGVVSVKSDRVEKKNNEDNY